MSKITCVCDANLWIDACHGNIEHKYLNKYSLVGFVEQVCNEINKFKFNEDKFKYVYDKFKEHENLYQVLSPADLGRMESQFLSKLRLKGFNVIDNKSDVIKDLGEYASLYYAFYMGIPYIHTTDLDFIDNEIDRLNGIEIITWNEVCDEITDSDDERLKINKEIELRKQDMNAKKQKKKQNKNLNMRLQDLIKKNEDSRL